MPEQYVRWLSNSNVANVECAPALPENSLDVSVVDSELRWQHGDRRLHVKVAELRFASLSIGSHGPKQSLFFTLHLGHLDGGGVRMLISHVSNADDFDEILSVLTKVLPCELRDYRNNGTEQLE